MIKIIDSRDLRDGAALNLRIHHYSLIALRKHYRAFVYLNQCPHLGLALERRTHDFLNSDNSYIQCANHGALFEIHNGECLSGPCQGAVLQRISIQEFDGAIWTNHLPN